MQTSSLLQSPQWCAGACVTAFGEGKVVVRHLLVDVESIGQL
jgi:hypothetical protein